jgi:hypothetical protein
VLPLRLAGRHDRAAEDVCQSGGSSGNCPPYILHPAWRYCQTIVLLISAPRRRGVACTCISPPTCDSWGQSSKFQTNQTNQPNLVYPSKPTWFHFIFPCSHLQTAAHTAPLFTESNPLPLSTSQPSVPLPTAPPLVLQPSAPPSAAPQP